MMKHRVVPKTLNIKTLNPMIDFTNSPFKVADRQTPWNSPAGYPRRPGVSAFGFGGVNCHVVLEDGPQPQRASHLAGEATTEAASQHYPFLLSAKTDLSLTRLLRNWVRFVESEEFSGLNLADVCRTLMVGREHFQVRFGVCVHSKSKLKTVLSWPLATSF